MEDALVQTKTVDKLGNQRVLVLVLMEDALVRMTYLLMSGMSKSLNPCFNGRCTRTKIPRPMV